MINRNEILAYSRSEHFKKRARQRFGISKSLMQPWLLNIVSHGSFSKTNQDGIWFLDVDEIRVVVDVHNRSVVTTYSLHDIVWISKRAGDELINKGVIDEVIDGLTGAFDSMLRKQNKKINSIIKALDELQDIHNVTKRKDYYLEQEDKICEIEKALTTELNNKRELIKIQANVLCKE